MKSSKLLNNMKTIASVTINRQFHVSKSVNVFEGIFNNSKVSPATQAHSVLLANPQVLYDLQIHNVKPEKIEEYEKICQDYMPKMASKYPNAKLTGSWRTEIGTLDQYVHLWQYKSYSEYATVFNTVNQDDENRKFKSSLCKLIEKRENQICLSFSFWGTPTPRDEPHIYEMRSYTLQPGTLIEWGNNWERGIRNRLDYCVSGMFTQIGPLFNVHHIWAYKSLADRKEAREKMWSKPGWDECVSYTVPLIREMKSKIMTGLPYSTMK